MEGQGKAVSRQWKVKERQWKVKERQWKVKERHLKVKERHLKVKERHLNVKERARKGSGTVKVSHGFRVSTFLYQTGQSDFLMSAIASSAPSICAHDGKRPSPGRSAGGEAGHPVELLCCCRHHGQPTS